MYCKVRWLFKNDALGIKGTIGIFGEIKNALEKDSIQSVALSSPHVISNDDIVCSSTVERIGECIWPGSKANIHDVSIVKIDSSLISTLQRTVLKENITIEEIQKKNFITEKFSSMEQPQNKHMDGSNK